MGIFRKETSYYESPEYVAQKERTLKEMEALYPIGYRFRYLGVPMVVVRNDGGSFLTHVHFFTPNGLAGIAFDYRELDKLMDKGAA